MKQWIIAQANPTRFLSLTGKILPVLSVLAAFITIGGLGWAWFGAPPDYQQGETIKIMFLHVPASWLCLFFYMLMTTSALGTLVWRHPLADVSQKAAAPIGAAFTVISLVTGSLWGRPMWGTYWQWDGRMTSVLILFLIYCGILALWRAIDDPGRAARAVSVLTLIGVPNIVIIKFSVEWWNTLHQGSSVFRLDGPKMHSSMLYPLLTTAIGFTLLGLALHMAAMRTEILRRRVRTLTIMEAERLDATGEAQ